MIKKIICVRKDNMRSAVKLLISIQWFWMYCVIKQTELLFFWVRVCVSPPRWPTPPAWTTWWRAWSPTHCTSSPSWWPKDAAPARGAWLHRAPPLKPVGAHMKTHTWRHTLRSFSRKHKMYTITNTKIKRLTSSWLAGSNILPFTAQREGEDTPEEMRLHGLI